MVSRYKFSSNLSGIKTFILRMCVLIESLSPGGICEAVNTAIVHVMWSWAMPEARLKCCC